MPIEIRIDRTACQGAGACVRRAPRSFALDAERRSRALDPPGDDEATIRRAAAACPFFAIEVAARPASD
jgi:ferredoxin